uniref:Uncharacterized protein n=1 Tax=Physcomitrium patens TaxID=3218 RepID=A0A2K1JLI9_PHYPA|nr:hypothetical protein PHYPA_017243 [Physcomitrium patens]
MTPRDWCRGQQSTVNRGQFLWMGHQNPSLRPCRKSLDRSHFVSNAAFTVVGIMARQRVIHSTWYSTTFSYSTLILHSHTRAVYICFLLST